MEIIEFDKEDKYIKDFLKLPSKIYSKKELMEDKKLIKSFLLEKHILSHYFKLNKYLVYSKNKVVGRFIITRYKDEKDICYIGFFECIKDNKVAKNIFKRVDSFAKENNIKKIIGPVDASFWNKYRLKINMFDKLPYTGEPYNKDYYFKMFKDNKYKVIEHYVSNYFDKKNYTYENDKYTSHFNEFKKLGYEIIEPKREEFNKCIEDIYTLIIELYKDFPVFKNITKEEFINIFNDYQKIINMKMIRMAYYNKQPVGFFVSIPDYHNIVYNVNIFKLCKILNIKNNPNTYVMLYMGVDQRHKGLGKALVYTINEELKRQRKNGIGALMKDNKVTQKYSSDIIGYQYEYVLLEKNIKN